MLPTYRNQSVDLLRKSIDWFLHEGNTGILWVNEDTATEIYGHSKPAIKSGFNQSLVIVSVSLL